MCAEKQILVIYAAVNGFCDRMPLDRIGLYERAILSSIKPELLQSLLLSLSNGGGKNKNVLGDDNLISLQTFLKESAAAAMVVINNLKKDNQSRLLFFLFSGPQKWLESRGSVCIRIDIFILFLERSGFLWDI